MNTIENHANAEGCALTPRASRLARFRQVDPGGTASAFVSIGVSAIVLNKLLEQRNREVAEITQQWGGERR